jgi:NADH oxidase (H2O2-forming)
MPRKIVIIGAHAAAVDAGSAARKIDRTAEITLITTERHAGYSRCGIPFVIGGHIPKFTDLIVYPSSYYQMMKLDLRRETTATNIDTKAKTVDIQDKTGKQETLQYDSLIIATGANAFIPPIKGKEKQGILTVRTLEDGERINQAIEKSAKTAIVIGAGLIGLEVAIGLTERGLKTTVVEMLPQIMPVMLDVDMAKGVQEMLEAKGITIMLGKGVEEFTGTETVTGVIAGGQQIDADICVAAFGVRAVTDLAQKAGLAFGETRGIKVNPRMETSVPGIYAIGDCAETTHMITQRPYMPQLGTVAVKQGKVGGTNAAGGYAIFPGALGSAVTKFFDMEIGVTGLNEFFAKRAGLNTVAATISGKTKAQYYPGAEPIKVKIVAEKELERIVGAQIVGGEEVTQRINAISIGIQKQMTVRELQKSDTCYAPPLCETWELMALAAEAAVMKLSRQ